MVGQATTRGADTDRWVERLGRAGLAAKGVLYVTIAILALQVAFGQGGETTGQQGAISALASTPFGTVVLALLAIGLIGYSVWRLFQFFTDATAGEDGAKAVALRVGYLVRGLIYAGLAAFTIRILLGSGSGGSGGGGGEEEATAWLLDLPGGQFIVIAIGLVIVGVGLYQGYRGVTKEFRDDLDTARMSPAEDRTVTRIGMIGLAARAVVFTMIGWFLIQAALDYDPDQATGLDGALSELAQSGPGPWLLAIVAAGLLAYGVYAFAEARYGRIRTRS